MNRHVTLSSGSVEYVTDVAYPAHFHRETMPSWLSGALTALGRRAPNLAAPFTWLELGCGAGLGVLVAGACHPASQFIGIDISEREIACASQMARAARLDNVRFICQDIRAMVAGPESLAIPACDFIVSHGVYSWVAAPVREAMAEFIGSRLRPGGVAYLGYTSQPGAVAFSAAQKFMRLAAPLQSGDSAAKAGAGVELLWRLAQGGAGYFSAHPSVLEHLEQMAGMDRAYLAHEYLNAHWEAFHVSDVMGRLAQAGCDFAGSASLLENVDAVSLPAGAQAEVAQLQRQGADAALLETARDIARNQSLRRDLYQKRDPTSSRAWQLDADAHRAALLAQRVMGMPGAPSASSLPQELKIDTGIGPVTLAAQAVRPLLQALAQAPRSYAELASLPAYAGNPGLISPLLQILAWIGWIHWLPPVAAEEAASREAALARLGAVLNDSGLPLRLVGAAGTAMWPPAAVRVDS